LVKVPGDSGICARTTLCEGILKAARVVIVANRQARPTLRDLIADTSRESAAT
jgi:hypothetical protein